MKVITHFDQKNRIRLHTVSGDITKELLLTELKGIYSNPDLESDVDVLWDLRAGDMSSFSSADVSEVRELVSHHWGQTGSTRAAIVVSRDINFGLSKMYASLLEEKISGKVMVFRKYEDALEWLKS